MPAWRSSSRLLPPVAGSCFGASSGAGSTRPMMVSTLVRNDILCNGPVHFCGGAHGGHHLGVARARVLQHAGECEPAPEWPRRPRAAAAHAGRARPTTPRLQIGIHAWKRIRVGLARREAASHYSAGSSSFAGAGTRGRRQFRFLAVWRNLGFLFLFRETTRLRTEHVCCAKWALLRADWARSK